MTAELKMRKQQAGKPGFQFLQCGTHLRPVYFIRLFPPQQFRYFGRSFADRVQSQISRNTLQAAVLFLNNTDDCGTEDEKTAGWETGIWKGENEQNYRQKTSIFCHL